MARSNNYKFAAMALAVALISPTAWSAAPVRLDFEGLSPLVNGERPNVLVGTYYSGGSSSSVVDGAAVAAGVTPSLGVSFSEGAVAAETALGGNGGLVSVFGTTRNLLLTSGTSVLGSAALGTGVVFARSLNPESLVGQINLGFTEGFTTGLSFFFNALSDVNVSVLSRDGTSMASADFRLPSTGLCPTGQSRCEWNAATLAFEGTAYGVLFEGTAGDFALDNITLGQLDPLGALVTGGSGTGGGTSGGGTSGGGTGTGETPTTPTTPVTPIPEPSTYALMALGLAWVAWVTRRQTPPDTTTIVSSSINKSVS
jgi:PEP-CTERM motif